MQLFCGAGWPGRADSARTQRRPAPARHSAIAADCREDVFPGGGENVMFWTWDWDFGTRIRLPGPVMNLIRPVAGIGLVVVFTGVSIGPAVSAAHRHDVDFGGSDPGMHLGSVVPALDTGDFSDVFPRHGSYGWLTDLAGGAAGNGLIGQTIWTWAKRRRGAFGLTAGGGV